jgi:hypothetical protein
MGSHPASGGYKYRSLVLRDGVWRKANNPTMYKRKLLRSLQEILPDFEEEAKD